MIHIIYCYFILNAFSSGIALMMEKDDSYWRFFILNLLFGVFLHLYYLLSLALEKIDKLIEIRFLFFLTFTDRYRSWAENEDYTNSMREWYPHMTAYKQRIIRRWAKKYGVKL